MTDAEASAIIAAELFPWAVHDPEYNYGDKPGIMFGPGGIVERMREQGWYLSTEDSLAGVFAEFERVENVGLGPTGPMPVITQAVAHAAAAALQAQQVKS